MWRKNAECKTLMFFQQDVRYDLIESSFRGSVHGCRGIPGSQRKSYLNFLEVGAPSQFGMENM